MALLKRLGEGALQTTAVFGAEATSADFTDRFLSLFDTTLRGFEHQLDYLARYFDPASAPAQRETPASLDFLSWLSSWIGIWHRADCYPASSAPGHVKAPGA